MIKFKFNNQTKDFTVNITGEIGANFWGEGVTLNSVIDQVQKNNPERIVLNISSLGGDLMEGLAIHDYLKAIDKPVIANIIGSTASSGTVIALAADECYISENSRYLIHRASGMASGNAEEVGKMLDELQSYDNTIVNLYMAKTGKPENEIRELMQENKWLTAKEAIELGFVNGYVKKITNLKINNMDEEQAKALQAENEQLRAKVAELEGKLSEMTASAEKQEDEMIKSEVEAAVEAGKITDVEKDVYMNFGKGNLPGLRDKLKAIESKQKIFNFKPESPVNMTWSQLHKQNPKLLAELKVNNRKMFEKLYFDEFGTTYKF